MISTCQMIIVVALVMISLLYTIAKYQGTPSLKACVFWEMKSDLDKKASPLSPFFFHHFLVVTSTSEAQLCSFPRGHRRAAAANARGGHCSERQEEGSVGGVGRLALVLLFKR